MFMFQTRGFVDLEAFILPLKVISEHADIKCSPLSVSLRVSYDQQSSSFTATLQMFGPFFSCMTSHGHYHSRIPLTDFFFTFSNFESHSMYVTFHLPDNHPMATLIYINHFGDFRLLTPLWLSPPDKQYVDRSSDDIMYIAIPAAVFRDIAVNFSLYNTKIWVTASCSYVKFSVHTEETFQEIVLTAEHRQCMAGGFESDDDEVMFSFTLDPVNFFIDVSRLVEFVWFFRASDLRTMMKFFIGDWSHILIYYPEEFMTL